MKYRKKAAVVEAIQYTISSISEIAKFMKGSVRCPVFRIGEFDSIYISTREGEMECKVGDWIVKGKTGNFYPYPSVMFEDIYEKVEEDK